MHSSVFVIFEKKMKILGPEKGSQIGPKMAPKKVGKKDTSKSEIFTFFIKFNENAVFYNRKWASRADSIVFYNEFARPEGQENRGQCGQNLRKTMIFVFFFGVSLEKALWRFWAFRGPNLGSKKWFGSDENRVLKKRLVRRIFGNLDFRINGPTTRRSTSGQTSWKGGRGDG